MTVIDSSALLATGCDDGSVLFWNPAAGSHVRLTAHKNAVTCLHAMSYRRNDIVIR
jgi:hypothetical protein